MNFYSHEKTRKLEEERLNAHLAIEATLGQPRRRPSMLKIEPGREEEFRYLRSSLLASEQVDRLIAATELPLETQRATTPRVATVAAAQAQVTLARTTQRWPLGPVAERAGRTLRRLGEGLESWACPAPAEQDSGPISLDQR